jgi:hypothetical protein
MRTSVSVYFRYSCCPFESVFTDGSFFPLFRLFLDFLLLLDAMSFSPFVGRPLGALNAYKQIGSQCPAAGSATRISFELRRIHAPAAPEEPWNHAEKINNPLRNSTSMSRPLDVSRLRRFGAERAKWVFWGRAWRLRRARREELVSSVEQRGLPWRDPGAGRLRRLCRAWSLFERRHRGCWRR